jgi:hypothetical protein
MEGELVRKELGMDSVQGFNLVSTREYESRHQTALTPTRRRAAAPPRRRADPPTRRRADPPTRRPADPPTRRPADPPLARRMLILAGLLRYFSPKDHHGFEPDFERQC